MVSMYTGIYTRSDPFSQCEHAQEGEIKEMPDLHNKDDMIILDSITQAYKAKSALERIGYHVTIAKPSAELDTCGCRYAIKVKNVSSQTISRKLSETGIRIQS